MLRIDPAAIKDNPIHKAALTALFQLYPDYVFFSDRDTYSVDFIHPENNQLEEDVTVKLTHRIAKRSCHPGGKHDGQFRYEVLSNQRPLAQDETTTTLLSKGVLILTESNELVFKTKAEKKQRVVKMVKLKNGRTKEHFENEYKLTPPHMHMKPPVFTASQALLFMQKKTGPELYKVLLSGMTAEKSITLMIAILKAVKKQVHDEKRIHRDLTPDNIFAPYNPETNMWDISILDFDLAKWSGTFPEKDSVGTLAYASPEVFTKSGTTEKSDVYNLGCIISEIFGCKRDPENYTSADRKEEQKTDGGIFIDGIFENIEDGDKLPTSQIVGLITQMTRLDPKDRFSLDQAIEAAEEILLEYQANLHKTVNAL